MLGHDFGMEQKHEGPARLGPFPVTQLQQVQHLCVCQRCPTEQLVVRREEPAPVEVRNGNLLQPGLFKPPLLIGAVVPESGLLKCGHHGFVVSQVRGSEPLRRSARRFFNQHSTEQQVLLQRLGRQFGESSMIVGVAAHGAVLAQSADHVGMPSCELARHEIGCWLPDVQELQCGYVGIAFHVEAQQDSRCTTRLRTI